MVEKKVKGRKRHVVTDVCGNLLAVKVHAANIHDTKSGGAIFAETLLKYPTITGVCADAGYRKTFEHEVAKNGVTVDISAKIKPKEWNILPKRWIVERTLAWLNHSRRLSKDYEIFTISAENMVIISHIHTLLKRF